MKLFVDDVREPNDPYGVSDFRYMERGPEYDALLKSWTIARTFAQAVEHLKSGQVTVISLDHDLGEEKTGYDLCKWMTANKCWPGIVSFHTANPIGAKAMHDEWESYKKHVLKIGPETRRRLLDEKQAKWMTWLQNKGYLTEQDTVEDGIKMKIVGCTEAGAKYMDSPQSKLDAQWFSETGELPKG